MSVSVQVFMILLVALSYFVAPITIIWGWMRFAKRERPRRVLPILSLGGFVLATASALLAVASTIYARFHYFPFYDPLLLKIFRTGFLLSLGALLFGFAGMWRPGSLRWHSPTLAISTAAFWLLAAEGE